jgi:predicted MPP superfamily phosphohydrolase
MKYAIIPDLHERWDLLKKTWELHSKGYQLILLGDYVDSYTAKGDAVKFLLAVIHLIKETKAIALLGNHDYHYIKPEYGFCNGYQNKLAAPLKIIFEENKRLFKNMFVCLETKSIFSHAGLSKEYITSLEEKYSMTTLEEIEYITNADVSEFFFSSVYHDGRDAFDGPLWLRPWQYTEELFGDYTQYVGHTFGENVSQYKNMLVLDTGRPFLLKK